MSYIHFKSVYNNKYDKITFDGVSLSLAQLKKLISEKSKFVKQVDFDLEITNDDTLEGWLMPLFFSLFPLFHSSSCVLEIGTNSNDIPFTKCTEATAISYSRTHVSLSNASSRTRPRLSALSKS